MLETIIALATPPMKSALAIIRVSGKDALDIVTSICDKDITNFETRQIVFAHIKDKDNNIIDEVIMNVYIGPKSYTGENLVEIMCHGSMLIVNEIFEQLIAKGARFATGGEFTARAYMNNRMDLIQAEAVNDIINATTKEAKNLSFMSLDGKTSSLVTPLKTKIADLMANIEVNIDYPEYEDIEEVTTDKVIQVVDELHDVIQKLIIEGKEGRIVKEGIKVAIVGKPNVGKSSLLNALLNEEKAIVTDIAGTTRDIVEGEVNLGGITLHLLDTAGVREASDKVEAIGIDKSKKVSQEADLVLLVLDSSSSLTKDDLELLELTKDTHRIIVNNKADLIKEHLKEGEIYIYASNKDIDSFKEELTRQFGINQESYLRPSLNNARQIGLLSVVDESLLKAKQDALEGKPLDIVEVTIQHAYSQILHLLGEEAGTDITKEIFSRFCVGK